MTDEEASLNYAKIVGCLPMPSWLEAIAPREDRWYLDSIRTPDVWHDPAHTAGGETQFTTTPISYGYTVTVPSPVTTMADVIYRTAGRKVAPDHVYELDLEELVRRQWERTRVKIEVNLAETCLGGSNQMPPAEPLTAAKLIEMFKRIRHASG